MPEVKKGYSLSHAYSFFKEKYSKKGKKYKELDKTTYRNICYRFNQKLVETVLTGKVFKLSHGLGDIWIKKQKTNWENPPVDLNESKKAKKKIFHLNLHSDGWWARWYWTRNNHLISGVRFYSFHPSRENSREVAKIMKQEGGHKRFFS